MNARTLAFPVVAACLGLAGRLPAQSSSVSTETLISGRSTLIRPGIPASDGELSPMVQAQVARGDALTGMRRYVEAVRAYHGAAEIARREGHLPSFSLWHAASAYYYQGDPQRAAVALEQLSAEAARFGDVAVQALALFNAAWLNGEAGRGQVAATQVADLNRLLRSPYMPETVREHLTGRLNPTAAVAVTH